MRVRLFFNKLAILITRGGWLLKMGITSSLLIIISLIWYFGLQHGLDCAQSKIILQLNDLKQQKLLFDEAINEYKLLNEKINQPNIVKKKPLEPANYAKLVVDQAQLANLSLQSYTVKKVKDNFKQMIFNFIADYQSLLTFLDYLDQASTTVNCQRLKIIQSGHRLQIAYVCGIHTFVK